MGGGELLTICSTLAALLRLLSRSFTQGSRGNKRELADRNSTLRTVISRVAFRPAGRPVIPILRCVLAAAV